MSSKACTHCGCSEIDTDPARGDAVCTGCGSVLEDQIIVSEVQFQDTASGGSAVIGTHVSNEGPKGLSMGAGFHHGLTRESRAITLQNGKKRLQTLGNQLRLNQHCVDVAYNFFKMAVSRHLTRGRRTHHVTAACLYITCRIEKTPHMLLDFADILQTDVYVLGRTYLQLSKELCLKSIPLLDPIIYIQRFAHKLEFGDKTHEVATVANRLVQRMQRDWMAQGRRPSGLCGAALLVAARMFDFNRSVKDVVRVVQIGEGTIKQRLAEFEATPSSELTIDEFTKIDLEEEMDPPSFTEGRRKAKLQQLEEQGQLPGLTTKVSELQDEIDKKLNDIIEKKAKRFAKKMDSDSASICSSAPSLCELDSELEQLEKEQASQFIVEETASAVLNLAGQVGGENSSGDRTLEPSTSSLAEALTNCDKDKLLMPPPPLARPTAASLGLKLTLEEQLSLKPSEPEEEPPEESGGELDLSGIDDDEIDLYILSEREAKLKTDIWMRINAEYLEEQKVKEARRKEEQKDKPEKKKRKPRKKQPTKEASTAREAIEKMLQEKKISTKINYDVLRTLTADLEKAKSSKAELGDKGPVEATPITLPTTPQKRFRRLSSSQPQGVKTEMKASRVVDLTEPPEKKLRLDASISEEPAVAAPPTVPPVQEEAEDVEDDEEDEDEEEEDAPVSAVTQLIGQHAPDDFDDYEDGYEEYD